jgi:serine/threonine protein kinase/Tol biopolymer transport system component
LDIEVGKQLLQYTTLRRLGAGGMGVVYEAEDTKLGRHVALKFLSPQAEPDTQALERFKQEARAASALNHPNICTIYAIEECEGHSFIAMELLEGQSLSERIDSRPMPLDKILDIGIQITDALDVAHQRGIVHRDLKPGNIFITNRGQAKILDFGLAKLMRERRAVMETAAGYAPTYAPPHLTSPGTAVGTVAYMSPEQARGEELDGRSDLFSMGAILYEMVTGHIAFDGTTTAVIFSEILTRNPRPPSEFNPAISPKLEEIISKALEKDLDLRYQTAAELRGDLKRLKRDSESGKNAAYSAATVSAATQTAASSPVPPSPSGFGAAAVSPPHTVLNPAATPLAATRRGSRGLILGGLVVLLLALALAWYFFFARTGGKDPTAFQNMTLEKLTDTGKIALATISQDGRYLFNVHDDGRGTQSLWMRHVATGSNQEIIPSVETQYTGLTFSPDGNYLYFVRIEPQRPDIGLLYQVPVLGGSPRVLITDVDSAVSFSPDGKQVVFLRNSGADADSKLIIADADGSNERVLAKLPLPGYKDPAWSPDGKTIVACVLDPGGASLGRLVGLDPDSGREHTIYAANAMLSKPAWLPDSKTIAFLFQDSAMNWDRQIGEVRVRNGKFRRITNDLNVYNQNTLAITRDGEEMVAVQVTSEIGLYLQSSEPNAAGTPVLIDQHGDTNVGWSKDGRLVVLDNDGHLASMNADGSGRTVLFSDRLFLSSLSVCQDNRRILFSMPNRQTRGLSIWSFDTQAGNPKPLTSGKADQDVVCSPDSQFFLYTKLENGRKVLMRMPIEGGEAKQIFDTFAVTAAISPDGSTAAVVTIDGSGTNTRLLVKLIELNGGATIKSLPVNPRASGTLQFSADGRFLYYPVNEHGVSNLIRQPLDGGDPVMVTQFNDLRIYGFSYDWTNKKLAVARGHLNADAVMIRQQAE